MQHTPGPWEIGFGDSSQAFGVFTKTMLEENTMEPPICLVSPASAVNETDKANAKLIAAAPDLLKSCLGMIKAFNDAPAEWLMTNDVQNAEAVMKSVIKKAIN